MPPTGGFFHLCPISFLSMSTVQLRALLVARERQRRAAIERDHAVTACSTQVVIV